MQSVRNPLEYELDDLTMTVWILSIGLALTVLGFGLEWWGLETEAGLSGALAVILIVIAVVGQLIVWALGRLD